MKRTCPSDRMKNSRSVFARSKIARVDYGESVLRWDEFLEGGRKHGGKLPEIDPQALALLQYTGGTTGTPKGAMLTHANLSINAQQVAGLNGKRVEYWNDGDWVEGCNALVEHADGRMEILHWPEEVARRNRCESDVAPSVPEAA